MSLLGNKLAGEFLHRTGDDGDADGAARLSYQAASSRLRTDFSQFDLVEWNRDLYWAWLSVLDPLLRDPALGSPTCMASPAYQATRLNSALASWTQLRIDTALYTRKADLHALKPDALKGHELAVAPALQRGGEVAAYLEPLPELYGRLLALTRMTAKELQSLDLLTDDASQRLSALEQVLAVLLALAEKELDNESLSAAEQETLRRLPERLGQLAGGEISGPMVVTVATDATGAWVLQEAVGRPDLAMFVIRLPDARLVVFTGAVQSYYEFKRPRAAALTRESWLELLRATPGPSRPEWLRN